MIGVLTVVHRRFHRSALRYMSTTTSPNADSPTRATFCLLDYDAVGFDLDNTLARYRLPALFELIHQSVRDYLSTNGRRPTGRLWPSARAFSQRGLLLDKKRGLLVKFDASGRVDRALKGFTRLSHDEMVAKMDATLGVE